MVMFSRSEHAGVNAMVPLQNATSSLNLAALIGWLCPGGEHDWNFLLINEGAVETRVREDTNNPNDPNCPTCTYLLRDNKYRDTREVLESKEDRLRDFESEILRLEQARDTMYKTKEDWDTFQTMIDARQQDRDRYRLELGQVWRDLAGAEAPYTQWIRGTFDDLVEVAKADFGSMVSRFKHFGMERRV